MSSRWRAPEGARTVAATKPLASTFRRFSRFPFSSRRLVSIQLVLLGAAAALWCAVPRQPVEPAPFLRPGVPESGPITGVEPLRFRLELRRGDFVQIVVFQRGVDLAVELLDPIGQGMLLVDNPLGVASNPERIFALASAEGEHRLAIRSSDPRRQGEYRVHVEAVRPASEQDRILAQAARDCAAGDQWRRLASEESALRRALAEYRSALDLWVQAGEKEQEALTRYRLGLVLAKLGEHSSALEQFQWILSYWQNRPEEIPLLHWIGDELERTGEGARALGTLEHSLELARQRGDLRGEAVSLDRLARVQLSLEEIQAALQGFHASREKWLELGEPEEAARLLFSTARTYAQIGQSDNAARMAEEALPVLRPTGSALVPDALYTLGLARADLGELQAARKALGEGLKLSLRTGDRDQEVSLRTALGFVELERGRTRRAIRRLEEALELARELGNEREEAHALAVLAKALGSGREDWDQALTLLLRARTIYGRLADESSLAASLYGLGLALRHTGRRGEAQQAFEEALKVVEQLRSGMGSSFQGSFLAGRHEYFPAYVDLLLELDVEKPGQGYAARAFEVGERARARAFLDELWETRQQVPADRRLMEAKSDLERRIGQLAYAGMTAGADGSAEPSQDDLAALLRRHQEMGAEIAAHRQGSDLPPPQPLTVEEVQQLLDPDTVLLAYMLGEGRSFLWRISPDQVTAYPLPPQDELETSILAAHRLLSRRRSQCRDVARDLRSLAATLLGPVAPELGERRLVILADGALHYMPFAALADPAAVAVVEDHGCRTPPLVARHEIVYLPSASVLAFLRQALAGREPPPKTVAVVANPRYSMDPRRVGGPAVPLPGLLADAARSARDLGLDGFQQLPYTEKEAESILRRVPPGTSFSAQGFDASRQAAMSPELGRHRIVHFAAHGLLNEIHPQLSGIVLSLVDAQGRPRDGFLRLYDIYNLDLPVELVVLSACRTGLGKEVRGEGLIGLTRGFMYAGAPRVVVSLWDVDDRATAALMDLFYEGLLDRQLSPAEALQRAQVRMSEDPKWDAPYFWAGFVLQGEWR